MKKILAAVAFLLLGINAFAVDYNNMKNWNGTDLEAIAVLGNYYNIVYEGENPKTGKQNRTNRFAYCSNRPEDIVNYFARLNAHTQILEQRHGKFSTSVQKLAGDMGLQTGIDWKSWLDSYNGFLCYLQSTMNKLDLSTFLMKEHAFLTFFKTQNLTPDLMKVYKTWHKDYQRFRTEMWVATEFYRGYSPIAPLSGFRVLTDSYFNYEGFYGDYQIRNKEIGKFIQLIAQKRYEKAVELIKKSQRANQGMNMILRRYDQLSQR